MIRRHYDVVVLCARLGIEGRIEHDRMFASCPNPAHDDAHPSWSIHLSGPRCGQHHCFGCKYGGGPHKLVRTVRGIYGAEARKFLDSVPFRVHRQRLADKTGAETTQLTIPPETIALWGAVPWEMRPAVEFLHARGFADCDIEHHGIGATPEHAADYGGRIIVPVVVDRVLVDFVARRYVEGTSAKAIGGRIAEGADKPHALWGFDDLVAGEAVVVTEGVWGAQSVRAAGHRNAVASCGSHWTPERTELLARHRDIVLMPDGDAAGFSLISKASGLRHRSNLRIAELPSGAQPDRLHPRERLRLIREAVPYARWRALRATAVYRVRDWTPRIRSSKGQS